MIMLWYLINEEPLQVTITDANYAFVTIDSQEYLTQNRLIFVK